MHYKSISPEILVNKGNKWRNIENCYYNCGIIQITNTGKMYIAHEAHNIPLIQNQFFGIQFGLNDKKGKERDFVRKLSYQIKYPDKQNEGAYITTETHFDYEINTYQFIWQKLDTEAEMAFGQWTFTIIDEQTGNQLLVENFNVFYPSI